MGSAIRYMERPSHTDQHMVRTHRRPAVVIMLSLFIIEISSHNKNSVLKGM